MWSWLLTIGGLVNLAVVRNWRCGKRGKDEHFQTLEIWIDLEDLHNFRSSDVS